MRFLVHPAGKVVLGLTALMLTVGLSLFLFVYFKYTRLIDEKLDSPFSNTSKIYAAPQMVKLGEDLSPSDVVAALRRAGYGESKSNRLGSYVQRESEVQIYPGAESYHRQEEAVIRFKQGKVSQLVSLRDNTERTQVPLEPELITNLFDRNREKRRVVQFQDIPPMVVHAVISVEDKRFFQHAGFDPLRILKAAYVDIKTREHAQGASTLSMQLARMFFLEQRKTWRRKAEETIITMELERRLTKEKIFEHYANSVDIGRRGSFAIRGLAEASLCYFGRDLGQLSLPEAATLAGLIQRPSATNPFKWPDRAKARRNVVLSLMRENGYIKDREYAEAAASPLVLNREGMETTDAPYFVDLVNDELEKRFQDHDFQNRSYRIYTTLDMNLQREASEAVRIGMAEVDVKLKKRRKKDGGPVEAQVAMVVLDSHTGEMKALVGGRNYGMSQLNRSLAKRQPGSSFKPFVYAAALNTALVNPDSPITPATVMEDAPMTFYYDGRSYSPGNHRAQYYGRVTVRQALAKSLNIPTVELAEAAGYGSVVRLARNAGMNLDIRPTPSVALGAYEVTPIEIAGSYTAFSNRGVFVKPHWVKTIRSDMGDLIFDARPERRAVLEPRVAYLVTNMMEEVLRSGTGAGVRSRGFTLPAAGKTGSSHDGWFAGFTDKLICVVWVGFDDNSELGLEGAHSALPVWAEFMKRAHRYREYASPRGFEPPEGVVIAEIDPLSGMAASPRCPNTRSEVFIAGSQPHELCRLHRDGSGTFVGSFETAEATPANQGEGQVLPSTRRVGSGDKVTDASDPKNGQAKRSKGFFGKLRDLVR